MREKWYEDAACRGVSLDRIYGEPAEMKRFARQYCQFCPVKKECLQTALDFHDEHGVWGGLLPYSGKRGA